MTAEALVVHPDQATRRLVSHALTMFRPGYRVSSAQDLDAATQWLDVLHPEVIVLAATTAGDIELAEWLRTPTALDSAIVILGKAGRETKSRASAILPEPVSVSSLIEAVRRIGANPSSGMETTVSSAHRGPNP